MNPKSALSLLLLTATLLAGLIFGIPAARAAEATQPETTDADEPPTEGTDADASAGTSSEVFIPTEEISEDFAVSFPVDI